MILKKTMSIKKSKSTSKNRRLMIASARSYHKMKAPQSKPKLQMRRSVASVRSLNTQSKKPKDKLKKFYVKIIRIAINWMMNSHKHLSSLQQLVHSNLTSKVSYSSCQSDDKYKTMLFTYKIKVSLLQ